MSTTVNIETKAFSVAERLERLPLTSYQIKLMMIIGVSWFFECIDVAMMTFALAPIKTEFALDTVQAGILGSMTFVGMFIGALGAGFLADHFGRLRVLQWSMICWGIASLLCALAPSVQILMVCRILLGIGMAMELVAASAIVSEFAPAKLRGKMATYMLGLWPLGFISAGLLAYFFIPLGGWRLLFIAQAVPSLFVFFVRRNMPESPRWLAERGYKQLSEEVMAMIEAKVERAAGEPLPLPRAILNNQNNSTSGKGFAALFKHGLAKRTIMLWGLWFFSLLGYYGLSTWLGTFLTDKGYLVTKSSLYLVLMASAGIPSFILLSKLVEYWGRKPSMIITLLGTAFGACLYGNASNLTQVIVFGLIMQFFMFGMWCALYAYTPDLYPTGLRATGAGCASAAGRVGALIGPYVVGLTLPFLGQAGVFELGAGAFVLAALITFVLGEETKGKILEEISPTSLGP